MSVICTIVAIHLHKRGSKPGLEVYEVEQVICSSANSGIHSLLVQHCGWDASRDVGGAVILGGQAGGGARGAPLTGCAEHLHHSWGQLSPVSLQQQREQ